MAKGNDKLMVKLSKATLVGAISNLLESHRERTFRGPNGGPLSRKEFCENNGLTTGTVSHIETGRFLGLTTPHLRQYLAVTHRRADAKFAESLKKVYDGLRELDVLLKKL